MLGARWKAALAVGGIVMGTLAISAPAHALDDDFTATSWDTQTWRTRTPLPRAVARTGAADAAADDGAACELVYPRNRPDSEWGPRYATQISSVEAELYGDYTARLQSARGRNDREGVISAFFTYFNDETDHDGDGIIDNHEIDFELSNTERSVLYLSVWTDYQYLSNTESFHRVGARVDLATGSIRATPPGGEGGWDAIEVGPLPFTVPDFDHSAQYYTYGFEWRADRVTFWIDLEDGAGPRELWEVTGNPGDRIPNIASPTFFNVWHNPVNWFTRADAPAPTRNAVMRVDWVSVTDGAPPTPDCTADAECDDGNPCNGFEACDAGACVDDLPVECTDASACTTSTCDPVDASTWECVAEPIDCDDGDACTVDGCDAVEGCFNDPIDCGTDMECVAGACVPISACLPHNTECSSNEDCCSGRCRGGNRARCLGN